MLLRVFENVDIAFVHMEEVAILRQIT